MDYKTKPCVLKACKDLIRLFNVPTILLSIDSKDIWALNTKGLALNELDKHKDAMIFYDRVIELDDKNITALLNKANTFGYLDEYKKAAYTYDTVQQIDSTIKGVSEAKADMFSRMGYQDESFLAAQGILIDKMQEFKKKCQRKQMFRISSILHR